MYFLPKREKKRTFSSEIPAVCWHYSELSKQSTGHLADSHTQSPLISFLKMSGGLCFEGYTSPTTTASGSNGNFDRLSRVTASFLPTLRKTVLCYVLQEHILLLGYHLITINWLFISRSVLFKLQAGTHYQPVMKSTQCIPPNITDNNKIKYKRNFFFF